MDPIVPKGIYNFDEYFLTFYGIQFLRRRSSNSPYEIYYTKRIYIAAAGLTIHILTLLATLVQLLNSSDAELSKYIEVGALTSGTFICFSRGCGLLFKYKELNKVLRNLEKLFPTSNLDQMKYNYENFCNVITLRNRTIRTLLQATCTMFSMFPMLRSIFDWAFGSRKYRYQYAFFILYPFDTNQLIVYVCLYILHFAMAVVCGLFAFNDDLLFTISVAQLCMHYKFLCKSFCEMDARKDSKNYQKLRTLIRYQYALQGLRTDISEIFSFTTFISFTIIKITVSTFVFTMYHEDDYFNMIPYVFSCFALLSGVFMKCYYGLALYNSSLDLLHAIYDHNWYEGTPKYRRMIAIMMTRANRPEELEASTLNRISMEFFKEVVIQTYQIFMLLHNFTRKNT